MKITVVALLVVIFVSCRHGQQASEQATRDNFRTVYFAPGSAVVSDPDNVAEIKKWVLAQHSVVLIEGHSCLEDENTHKEDDLLHLLERRALAVKQELMRLGVPPDLMHTIAYGKGAEGGGCTARIVVPRK
jgi:outer membrane protein OmpA-like peptidoglycan-associated protein